MKSLAMLLLALPRLPSIPVSACRFVVVFFVFFSCPVLPAGVMEGQRQVFGPKGTHLDLKRLERCQHTLKFAECSCSGFRHWQPGPDISTSGLDLTSSRKFPVPAEPEYFFCCCCCCGGELDVSVLWDVFAGHLVVMANFSWGLSVKNVSAK